MAPAANLRTYGMYRSPHKKGGFKSVRDNPVHGKYAAAGGHSGGMPPGKLPKGKRFATQPPGYPQGKHVGDGRTCLCGRCYVKTKTA